MRCKVTFIETVMLEVEVEAESQEKAEEMVLEGEAEVAPTLVKVMDVTIVRPQPLEIPTVTDGIE